MKLKYVIGILWVLNAAVLAWQWNAFARWGWGPDRHREPERVQQQIRPEALKFEVVPKPAARASEASPQQATTPDSAAVNPAAVNPATLLPSEGLAVPPLAASASSSAAVVNPAGAVAPSAPLSTPR
ncbi:hypothetical protein B9Z47_02515 [Limnohabitans sp. 2KL-1]|uniref:hypothetical protein n=1 Tax=Limnohabitans sp. 2KL-1 TaxID=1100699 RepID=UPI000D3AEC4A|nr:hypothetical protein [Limnohabitans sp. 2KL-1]PUE50641.1 hypothetical protein B9Z47_02515 [Limnohabitans sp. 2KL-1]